MGFSIGGTRHLRLSALFPLHLPPPARTHMRRTFAVLAARSLRDARTPRSHAAGRELATRSATTAPSPSTIAGRTARRFRARTPSSATTSATQTRSSPRRSACCSRSRTLRSDRVRVEEIGATNERRTHAAVHHLVRRRTSRASTPFAPTSTAWPIRAAESPADARRARRAGARGRVDQRERARQRSRRASRPRCRRCISSPRARSRRRSSALRNIAGRPQPQHQSRRPRAVRRLVQLDHVRQPRGLRARARRAVEHPGPLQPLPVRHEPRRDDHDAARGRRRSCAA